LLEAALRKPDLRGKARTRPHRGERDRARSGQGKLLRTVLAGVAEVERDIIRERTGDGRKRAMANGVKFGRKPKLSPFQRAEAIKRRGAGETLAAIAKSYAVDVSTIAAVRSALLRPERGPPVGFWLLIYVNYLRILTT